ncbi:MAG: lipoyl(octanoyl) transferase LipB [Actinomycetota bacterium]|nr:lipoyl(octanoyl) transferase LipB [Actinomycetota bacterium]
MSSAAADPAPQRRPAILTVDAGRVAYEEALRWQRLLVAARLEDRVDDVMLTLEHDPVYTAGRRADVAANVLGTRDIPVVRVDRGGDVTYHGPGQLVAYPVVKLRSSRQVRPYVDGLEEACVRAAADFGVHARPSGRSPTGAGTRRTGVWVDDQKLAAVGVRVRRGVTSHGLAFNVSTDLDDFGGIVPCGLADAGVCSLRSLGVEATVDQVRARLVEHLGDLLGRRPTPALPAALGL